MCVTAGDGNIHDNHGNIYNLTAEALNALAVGAGTTLAIAIQHLNNQTIVFAAQAASQYRGTLVSTSEITNNLQSYVAANSGATPNTPYPAFVQNYTAVGSYTNIPLASSANAGFFYQASDTGVTYRSDGVTWSDVEGTTKLGGSIHAAANGVASDAVAKTSGGAVNSSSTAFTGSGFLPSHVGRTIAIAGAGVANVATTTADVVFPQAVISISSVSDARLNTAGGSVVVGGHPVIYQGISGNTLTGCSGGVSGVTVTSGAAVTCPGPAGHVTTIAQYIDATHVTLASPAPVTVTNAPYWHYIDGTDALQVLANQIRLTNSGQPLVISGTVVVSFRPHPQNSTYKVGLYLGSGTRLVLADGATIMLAPYQPTQNSANCSIIKNYNIAGSGTQDKAIVIQGGTVEGNALYQQANFYTGVDGLRVSKPRCEGVTVKNIRGLTQSSGLLPGGETVFFSQGIGDGPIWRDCVADVDQGWVTPGVIIGGNSGKIDNGSNIFITTATAFPEGFSAKHIGWWIQLNFPGNGTFMQAVITQIDSSTQCRLSVNNPSTNKLAANWSMGAMCASGFSANIVTGPKWIGCISKGITINNAFTENTCRGSLHLGCSAWLCWNMMFNIEVSPDAIISNCHAGGKAAASSSGTPFITDQVLGSAVGNGFIFNGSINGQLVGSSARSNGSSGVSTAAGGSATVNGGMYMDNQQWGISQDMTSTTTVVGNPTVTGNSVGQVNTAGGVVLSPAYAPIITIPVWTPPVANVNWPVTGSTVNSTDYGNSRIPTTSPSIDNSIEWDIVLGPGTYTFMLPNRSGANVGIYTITLNGLSLTSLSGSADNIDGYAASSVSQLSTITGIVIPYPGGVQRFKILMHTKNASSTGYNGTIEGAIVFVRTAV